MSKALVDSHLPLFPGLHASPACSTDGDSKCLQSVLCRSVGCQWTYLVWRACRGYSCCMARMQHVLISFCPDPGFEHASFAMACCAAGDGETRQISADWRKGKLEQQLVLLMATEIKNLPLVVTRRGLGPVSFALSEIVILCSRPVGICVRAMTVLPA